MDSEELVLHAAVGYFQSLDFSIPGTRAGQGHSVVANLASSIAVVVVGGKNFLGLQAVVGLLIGPGINEYHHFEETNEYDSLQYKYCMETSSFSSL